MESYPNFSHGTPAEFALKYAERGKPVFPCRGNKAPCTPNGFKDASSDPERVSELWRLYPGEKIGMPTGRRSGVFVVDVDRLEALGELPDELPETLTVRTPSGGLHFYLNHVDGVTNRTGGLPDGIDIRGDGGYVIVAPSKGYEVERRAPVADAPVWLVDAMRDEPVRSHGRKSGGSVGLVDDGGPIPEGKRDQTLASVAGRLHDGTRDLNRLEDELQAVNEARCLPPLPFGQVRKIARSVYRYEPCQPGGPDPQTEAALGRVERLILEGEWKGKGGKTRYSLSVAWLKLARRHGRLGDDGVTLEVSWRQLALAASVSRVTAMNNIRAMTGMFRVDGDGAQSGKSGTITFLLPPAPIYTTLPTESVVEGGCIDWRAPFTAPRLRWSTPPRKQAKRGVVRGTRRVRESAPSKARDAVVRLGKGCEHAVDLLEAAGAAMSLEVLARDLDVSRARDLTRRVNSKTGKGRDGIVTKLVSVGVVEVDRESVSLTPEWLDALNEERERSGEIALFRRDLAQYNRERDGYRNRSRRETLAKPRDADAVADGHIEELRPVEDTSCDFSTSVSPLAEAVRDYLDRNPHDARRSPYWIGTTLWSYDLFGGKPTTEETRAAIEELGGARYLEGILRRAKGAA